jgi:hypothetical protein
MSLKPAWATGIHCETLSSDNNDINNNSKKKYWDKLGIPKSRIIHLKFPSGEVTDWLEGNSPSKSINIIQGNRTKSVPGRPWFAQIFHTNMQSRITSFFQTYQMKQLLFGEILLIELF